MPPPVGTIAIWTGLLANIPANWNLCDGAAGTPDLIAQFIRGAPAGIDPGGLGGSDMHAHAAMTPAGTHSHTLPLHNHPHITSMAGGHNHVGTTADRGAAMIITWGTALIGSHNHWTAASSPEHIHTALAAGSHTHIFDAADGRPPFYEVAYIQAAAGAAAAADIIIIWTGLLASMPAGWALCDGGGGRPDLRRRFLRGVNTALTNPGAIGGAVIHNHTTQNSAHTHATTSEGTHTHTYIAKIWTHDHNVGQSGPGTYGTAIMQNDTGGGDHTHANTDSIGSHSHLLDDAVHSHVTDFACSLPAYYDVAFIINVAATVIPIDGILIWTGLLANIPAGYSLCDGEGGRPDLRERFIRGAPWGVEPGRAGGSDYHYHSPQAGGAHTHVQNLAGAHTHANTNTAGAHTHAHASVTYLTLFGAPTTLTAHVSAGEHSHAFPAGGDHIHSAMSNPGNDHTHNPLSTDDGRPAYYEVAFVIRNNEFADIPTRFILTAPTERPHAHFRT